MASYHINIFLIFCLHDTKPKKQHCMFIIITMQKGYVEMAIRSNKKQALVQQYQPYQFSEIQGSPKNRISPKKNLKISFSTMKSGLKNASLNRQKKKFSWAVYKKLLKYSAKEWKMFLISMTTLLVSSFFTTMIPYITGQLLDKINQPKDPNLTQKLTMGYPVMIGFLIGLCISTYIRTIVTSILEQRIAIQLRSDVFGNFIGNDIHFFQLHKSGQLNSRVGNDINQAKSATSNNITNLFKSITTIIGYICILMIMSWKLSLMILMLVPLYVLVTSLHNRKTKMLVRQYQDVQAEASVHLNQIFTGIQVVKAFSHEEKQITKYEAIQTKGYSINCIKSLFAGFYFTATIFLPNIGILMVLWYGGNLVMSGRDDMTAGQLTSFIMYCSTLSREATQISNGYNNIINGTSAVQKVFDMMEYEPQTNQKSTKKHFDYKLGGEIQFKKVNFQYPKGQVTVLRNLNLRITPGQYVAFVGQSGSGKSTIVKLIQRFYEIQSGELCFDGVNSKQMNIQNIRKQIGFVSQQAILFSGTIEDNITYGVGDYSNQDIIEASRQSGCLQFINNQTLFPEGFNTQVGEKGNQLSGGQRQRVSIARALIRKPKILIFDQATSALDSNSQHIVQQSIQNLILNGTNAMTIIVIAHRLSTIINAHRIYVMKSGEIVESGNHQTLLSDQGYYSQLFSKQLQNTSSRQLQIDST